MTTLKSARKAGNLDKFVKEHEADEPAEQERFDAVLKRMVEGKPKGARDASAPASDDD